MRTHEQRTRIGVTLGDPAGVGPELTLRAAGDKALCRRLQPVLYGQERLLRRVALESRIAWPAGLHTVASQATLEEAPIDAPALLVNIDAPGIEQLRAGKIEAAAGRAAYAWIRAAVADTLAGRLSAVATCPIHKQSLTLAGVPYPGHTEMLAALTRCARAPVMTFVAPELVVALATIHLPLADVPRFLTRESILNAIDLLAEALCFRLGRAPRIGVLALNPHAGEGGQFGDTESTVIAPSIAAARASGHDVEGPLVPDAAFVPAHRARFDAFIAMYHDQGLIPFKMLAFDHGVNVTFGLPIVRTSVDHGTAFDIARQGLASPDSLLAAIRLAAELARQTPV